jgi:hypothetical protein
MYTPRVLSLSSSFFTPAAAKVGKLASLALMAGSLAVLAPQAHANDFNTVVGAGIGAVAGAAIGNHVGGRNGAIVGAGAGGLVGASIASQHHGSGYAPSPYPVATHYQQPVTYYQPQPQYHVAPPVTYYQPRPQYRVVQPVTYYQPAVVAWQAPAPHYRHWREERRHDHGHHRGRHDRHHDGHHNDYRR